MRDAMKRACLAALLAFGTGAAWAQSVKIERVEAAQFPDITVPMKFSGATMARTPVRADLALSEDGKSVRDFELTVDPEPLVISLVIDQSGSMTPAMDALKRAAHVFVDELPAGARVEVLAFSDQVVRLEGFSAERRGLRGAIDKLHPHGPTLLYDSILTGLDDLPGGGEGRRILIAFTDGRDQNAEGTATLSRSSARDVVNRARKAGIPLYLVGLGAEVQQKLLSKMAAVTGGQYFHAPSPDQLVGIYRDVARLLNASFRVTYRTPRPEPDGTRRSVDLVSMAKEFPGRAKGSYVAPATRSTPSPRPLPSQEAPRTLPVVSVRPVMHPIPPGAADPFALGLFGADSVTLAGNGSIDSYDSGRGPYEAQASTKALSGHGDVGSNGNVEVSGNGTISGAVVAGGTLQLANNATIEGKATAGGKVALGGNSVIDGGLVTNAEVSTTDNAEVKGGSSPALAPIPAHRLPAVDLAAARASNDDAAIESSLVTPASGTETEPSFSAGGQDEVTMPSGVYLFRSFAIQDSATVKLAGPVMIFVTESLRLEGSGLASVTKRPQDLVIYYTGTAPAICGGTSEFHGGIYAPSGPIEIVGDSDFFGGAVGKSLTVSGNGSIHLDRDLSAIMTAPGKTPPRTMK